MTRLRGFYGLLALCGGLILGPAQAQSDKQSLVLLPITGPGLSAEDRNVYQGALQQGLYKRYKVYAGSEVESKLKKYSRKICDSTKCLQEVAIDFQSELIGRGFIVPKPGGFLLTLEIKNIFTDELIETLSEPCANCSSFDVISHLKRLGSGKESTAADRATRFQAVTKGSLKISTDPFKEGALVYINDRRVGVVPMTLSLDEGLYNVEVRSGSQRGTQAVQVRPGQEQSVAIALSGGPKMAQADEGGVAWYWWVLGGLAAAGAAGGEEGSTEGSSVDLTW